MTREFLGVGWQFPVERDENGQVVMAYYEESIHQAIWLILGTAKGERVMRPDFGCGIHNLVFAINNTTTTGLVAEEVRQALIRWEPRIELLATEITSPPDQPNLLFIRLEYRIRTTNNVFNMVYPFYLERSAT